MKNLIVRSKELVNKGTEFLSDGCSMVPEFMMTPCCVQHDEDVEIYNAFKANWLFLKCMVKKTKNAVGIKGKIVTGTVAASYYLGVSLFGWAWRLYKRVGK